MRLISLFQRCKDFRHLGSIASQTVTPWCSSACKIKQTTPATTWNGQKKENYHGAWTSLFPVSGQRTVFENSLLSQYPSDRQASETAVPGSKFLGPGKPVEVFGGDTLQRVFRARCVLLGLVWSQLLTLMRDQAARKAGKQPRFSKRERIWQCIISDTEGKQDLTKPEKFYYKNMISGHPYYLGPYSIQCGFFSPIF